MSRVKVNEITNKVATGPVDFPDGITGVALTVTGNVTVGGTIISEDTTNVDSVGFITARAGLNVGPPATGIGATIHSDGNAVFAGIVTTTQFHVTTGGNAFETSANVLKGASGQKGIYIRSALSEQGYPSYSSVDDTNTGIFLPGSDVFAVTTGGSERLRVDAAGKIGIGTDAPAVDLHIQDGSGTIRVESTSDATSARIEILGKNNSYAGLHMGDIDDVDVGGLRYYNTDNFLQFRTNASERVRITSTGGLTLSNGELIEKCHIQSSPAWSSNGAVDLDNGVVQYNTTNYGSGGAGSLYFSSNAGINTSMATGDIMSLTMITNVNSTAGYINNIFIDNAAVTETWVGGSAPTAGGSSGVDIYTFNIIKTASATYTVIANQVKTSA